jgi:hypothetical protein
MMITMTFELNDVKVFGGDHQRSDESYVRERLDSVIVKHNPNYKTIIEILEGIGRQALHLRNTYVLLPDIHGDADQ